MAVCPLIIEYMFFPFDVTAWAELNNTAWVSGPAFTVSNLNNNHYIISFQDFFIKWTPNPQRHFDTTVFFHKVSAEKGVNYLGAQIVPAAEVFISLMATLFCK